MFELQQPWWEIAARAAIVYAALFPLIRVFGKRELGQLTAFDFIFLLLIAQSVSRAMTGGDRSLTAAFVALSTLTLINFAVVFVTARVRVVQRVLEGRPQFLIRAGRIDHRALRREGLTNNDLFAALREHGCTEPEQVEWAILETTGAISVKKRAAA
jgi:uncharacterized membrane protein YcaP (DUF421 family)